MRCGRHHVARRPSSRLWVEDREEGSRNARTENAPIGGFPTGAANQMTRETDKQADKAMVRNGRRHERRQLRERHSAGARRWLNSPASGGGSASWPPGLRLVAAPQQH